MNEAPSTPLLIKVLAMTNTTAATAQNTLQLADEAMLDALASKLADRMADDLAERVFQKIVERQEAAHQQQVVAEQAQALQAAEFQKSIEQIYARYPFMSDTSSETNVSAIQEALDLAGAMIEQGIPASVAVWQAAAKVGPKYETRPVH
ncbi:hypothetical protein K5D69_15275 [Pseudomonas cichorii]|uniref:hypothetical protein n=1 Tax=Pseudomonas cichorii TaxID=36746 RepID=UPI001C896661|nr:hypothetical protein [Pseudomonas cichorii]MBX8516056.1 hypothetical protein [Pseudomonas cichorii]